MINTAVKGRSWRRAVELWLQDAGFTTTSRGTGYAGDDITAVSSVTHIGLSVEAKNQKALDLAGFVDQAVKNAGAAIPVVVAHRRSRASVDDAYVVLRGRDFVRLLDELAARKPL